MRTAAPSDQDLPMACLAMLAGDAGGVSPTRCRRRPTGNSEACPGDRSVRRQARFVSCARCPHTFALLPHTSTREPALAQRAIQRGRPAWCGCSSRSWSPPTYWRCRSSRRAISPAGSPTVSTETAWPAARVRQSKSSPLMLKAILALLALQFAGDVVAHLAALPVPGMIIGLLLLLALLAARGRQHGARRAVPDALDGAAGALHRHFGLLFVPAGAAIVAHLD